MVDSQRAKARSMIEPGVMTLGRDMAATQKRQDAGNHAQERLHMANQRPVAFKCGGSVKALKKGGTAAGKPLGSGANFKAVERSAAASGASNPAAVAAAVGRKKYGAAKMAKLAAAGRKKMADGGLANRPALPVQARMPTLPPQALANAVNARGRPFKKGGAVHDDVAQDRKLIRSEIARAEKKEAKSEGPMKMAAGGVGKIRHFVANPDGSPRKNAVKKSTLI